MTGISLTAFTLLHVIVSVIGIVAGLIAVSGWLKSDPSRTPTAIFLGTAILTSATGFLFPFSKFLPSHAIGIISLVMLAVATFALYRSRLEGIWRPIFTVTATLSLYLNVFVLVVQSFLKIPLLNSLAPTQTEPAFLIAQGATLVFFLTLTGLTFVKFRPPSLLAVDTSPKGSSP